MRVANPKKLKKPTTSVTVVKITVLPMAGSTSNFLSRSGTIEPKKPAESKLIIIESAITMPRFPCQTIAKL